MIANVIHARAKHHPRYETSQNWTPSGKPAVEATFWRPGKLNVLFSGNESVQKLSLSNNTDVTFTPGNLSPTRRTFTAQDMTVIDNASLTLGGGGVATDLFSSSVATWNGGNLHMTNGSRWDAHSTVIYDGSSLNVSGADNAGTVSSGSTTHMQMRRGGELNLSDGALFESESIVTTTNSAVNVVGADALGNSTTVRILDGPSGGNQNQISTTDVNIVNGGQFEADRLTMVENSNVNVTGTSSSGLPSRLMLNRRLGVNNSTVRVAEGAEMMTGPTWIGSFQDTGRITLGSESGMPASWIASDDVVVHSLGDIFLRENTHASFTSLGIYDGGQVTVFENATLNANRIQVEQEFELINPFTDGLAGTLQVGTLEGDLFNVNGIVAPGPDAGLTSITGKYTQSPNAKLSIEVGGNTGGSDFDILNVGGHASLRGGDLELSLLDGFIPGGTDAFSILRASIITGGFDNVAHGERLTTLDGSGSFVVNYGPASPFDIDEVVLSDFMLLAGLTGDFNGDGLLDAADIDLLSAAVGGTDLSFDLSADGVVNTADREAWVEDVSNTYFGDSNLDGEFNSGDFVQVFQQGEYEDSIAGNSGWADGDWNGDGEFDSGDFVLAFQSGGYEKGPRTSVAANRVAAVSEPTTGIAVAFGLFGLIGFRRRGI